MMTADACAPLRFAPCSPVGKRLRVPSTGDLFGRWLYVVNARFDVNPTPDTDYNVVRVTA
jgi:hypothetical protein